jgi:transcriptional regulator with XRE-family HTH domain
MPPRLADLVDATTTRQQIMEMVEVGGMTRKNVADLAGIGRSTIYAIAQWEQARCGHRVADAIAALHAETIEANTMARTLFKRIVTEKPRWYDEAECRGLDPALFYPDRGEASDIPLR